MDEIATMKTAIRHNDAVGTQYNKSQSLSALSVNCAQALEHLTRGTLLSIGRAASQKRGPFGAIRLARQIAA
jgi:hypothetical protein